MAEHGRGSGYDQLLQSGERFRMLPDTLFEGVAFSVDGVFVDLSARHAAMYGYAKDELLGTEVLAVVAPESRPVVLDAIRARREDPYEFVGLRRDGTKFLAQARSTFTVIGGVTVRATAVQDLSEKKRSEQQASDALCYARTILDASPVGIISYRSSGHAVSANEAAAQILGTSIDDIIGKNFREMDLWRDSGLAESAESALATGAGHTAEHLFTMPTDDQVWVSTRIVPFEFEEEAHLLCMFSNITRRKQAEERLFQQANFDSLTGLPNRNLLLDRFNQAVGLKERQHSSLALILMDLDNFKIVNDTLGHLSGDLLLKAVVDRVRKTIRKTDTFARLGGDEFVIIPITATSRKDIEKVAELVLRSLAEPFCVTGSEVFITASIGIAIFPQHGETLELILRHADNAMYHAKNQGKNNYQFFIPDLHAKNRDRLSLETRLRHAIDREEFILHYQPQLDAQTGKIMGLEVLIRWVPEGGGTVYPDFFVPVLEELGLIAQVGEWVLETACKQLRQWHQDGFTDLRLAVNISARQFQSKKLKERIAEIVQESGCEPKHICLELTESIIMHDTEKTIRRLERLRQMGFSLSIDDFGTGFSSLKYLKRLPISELKIDRSFVAGIPFNRSDGAIISTIITLASNLQMKVIAEGVETEDHREFLTGNGCNELQGYFFSKPLHPDDCSAFLQSNWNRPVHAPVS